MTTIQAPTEAVRRQVKLHKWCLVVALDKKSPVPFRSGWIEGEGGNDQVVILTTEEQMKMRSPFVDAIPWNHFGCKNIGYLYAITHGASVIWDFDDDNMLKFWIHGAAPDGAPSLDATVDMIENGASLIDVLEPQGHNWPTYNPYPVMGAPSLPSWPRGLPLVDIKNAQCSNTTIGSRKLKWESFAVLQSLADVHPDVDAIYRITMPFPKPFAFKRTNETRPLIIPTNTLTPYNAQATLHFKSSFWALLLPITVHGKVSDIWRSYIAQRLFRDCDMRLGFTARPLVVHDRTHHSNLGDFISEQDLYTKSEHLVKFLGMWKGNAATLVGRIEELWIALYEHQYIEVEDVTLVQHWLMSLLEAGYKFPDLKPQPKTIPTYPVPIKRTTLVKEKCKISRSLTFLITDLPGSIQLDVPSILSRLGQSVILPDHKVDNLSRLLLKNENNISVFKRLQYFSKLLF